MTLQVEHGARTLSSRVEHVELVSPAPVQSDRLGHDPGRALADGQGVEKADVSRLLANGLLAGLDSRPFSPTAAQLAWVWGGELVRGEAHASRARVAADRYAGLFTDHVVQDVTVAAAMAPMSEAAVQRGRRPLVS